MQNLSSATTISARDVRTRRWNTPHKMPRKLIISVSSSTSAAKLDTTCQKCTSNERTAHLLQMLTRRLRSGITTGRGMARVRLSSFQQRERRSLTISLTMQNANPHQVLPRTNSTGIEPNAVPSSSQPSNNRKCKCLMKRNTVPCSLQLQSNTSLNKAG